MWIEVVNVASIRADRVNQKEIYRVTGEVEKKKLRNEKTPRRQAKQVERVFQLVSEPRGSPARSTIVLDSIIRFLPQHLVSDFKQPLDPYRLQ
jgi:hypothetical protein